MSALGNCVDCGSEIKISGHAAVSPRIGYRCSFCEVIVCHETLYRIGDAARRWMASEKAFADRPKPVVDRIGDALSGEHRRLCSKNDELARKAWEAESFLKKELRDAFAPTER